MHYSEHFGWPEILKTRPMVITDQTPEKICGPYEEQVCRHFTATSKKASKEGFEQAVKSLGFSQDQRNTIGNLYQDCFHHGFVPHHIDAHGRLIWAVIKRTLDIMEMP